jgi:Major Facilitator Superfamily
MLDRCIEVRASGGFCESGDSLASISCFDTAGGFAMSRSYSSDLRQRVLMRSRRAKRAEQPLLLSKFRPQKLFGLNSGRIERARSSRPGEVGSAVGVAASEVSSYPMNNRIITTWLPEKERATAVGVYVSGQYVGLAFLSPVLVLIQTAFGWGGMFMITGGLGILWALGFYLLYRDPLKLKLVNKSELDYIEAGGGQLD